MAHIYHKVSRFISFLNLEGVGINVCLTIRLKKTEEKSHAFSHLFHTLTSRCTMFSFGVLHNVPNCPG